MQRRLRQRPRHVEPVTPGELRRIAIELEHGVGREHHRASAELLVSLAGEDATLLRRALIGDAAAGPAPRLLLEAIDAAEHTSRPRALEELLAGVRSWLGPA